MAVMDWPVRPMLVEYERRLKHRLQRRHELELILWAALAPHQKQPEKPPKPHPLLRD